MKTVTLNNGVEMPVLGLGTYKTTDPSECLYQLQCGVIIIPKSVHRERIKANADVFDFELSPAEMLEIRSMDKGAPMTGTPETPDRVMKVTGFRLPDGK